MLKSPEFRGSWNTGCFQRLEPSGDFSPVIAITVRPCAPIQATTNSSPVGLILRSRCGIFVPTCANACRNCITLTCGDVAISFCQARKNVTHGLQASLTPLRFEHGATTGQRGSRRYSCQPVLDHNGLEYFYILSFYLPRFLNHSVEEKLSTLLHELWHISPAFDGDLRRHGG